jgi:splicing factor 3B subunit 3
VNVIFAFSIQILNWYKMHLYSLTLQRASAITHAIHGNFSGTKSQELVVARGGLIELLRPDPNTGKVIPVLAVEVFGVVRDIAPFRLTGGSKGINNRGLIIK